MRHLFARNAVRWAAFCSLLWAAGLAHANGRFPNAQQLRVTSAQSLVLTGTYGLLVRPHGASFRFVCESELFGQAAPVDPIDPLLEVLSDGTWYTGSPNALRVSRDGGCSFETETSLPLNPGFFDMPPNNLSVRGRVIDITPLSSPEGPALVALTSLLDAEGSVIEHRLYRTHVGTPGFQQLGSPIPPTLAPIVLTVDVAPSDPSRVYVSAGFGLEPSLLVSVDAADTWTSLPIPVDDVGSAFGAYIAAIAPDDADRIYVRVSRWSDTESGTQSWDDSLLVSRDAGASFQDVLRREGNLLGFAVAPDGRTVLAGFGDPQMAPIESAEDALGIYAARSDDLEFEHIVSELSVSCLRWTDDALYACARELDPLGNQPDRVADFHLGVYQGSELPRTRSAFTSLLKLKDVRGPLLFADSRPSACEAEWSMSDPSVPDGLSTCQTLNACGGSGGAFETEPPHCGVEAGGSGGLGAAGAAGVSGTPAGAPNGESGTAGALPAAGQAGSTVPSAGASGVGGPARSANEGGCGCRIAQNRGPGAALLAALLFLLRRVRRSGGPILL